MNDNKYEVERYEKAGCLAELLMILAMAFFIGLGIVAIALTFYLQGVPL